MAKQKSTIRELRDELVELRKQILSGEVDVKLASEFHNNAGKTINTVRAQLEYAKLRKEKPSIDFLTCD